MLPEAVYLDVGHNPAGMEKALHVLKTRHAGCDVRVVCGFSKAKSIADNIAEVVKTAQRVHFVSANHFRALRFKEYKELYQDGLRESIANYDSIMDEVPDEGNVRQGILRAFEQSAKSGKKEILVITGSVFIMEEVRDVLGFDDLKDPPEINS